MHEIKHTAGHHVHADHRTSESQLPETHSSAVRDGRERVFKTHPFLSTQMSFCQGKQIKRENSVGETKRERGRVLNFIEEDEAALPPTRKLSLQRKTEDLGTDLMVQHTTLACFTRQFELNGSDSAHIAEMNAEKEK